MLIVLSPSKTQDISHRPEELEYTIPQFQEEATRLVASLKQLSTEEIAELMKLSKKLATATKQRFTAYSPSPASDNAAPALLTFRGEVFAEIHADGYSIDDFTFAQKHLRILSGLYGILRPLDLMQPYRLEIGGNFAPDGAGGLYDFWRPRITSALQHLIAAEGHGELLNLASNEYFKGIETNTLQVSIIDVLFKRDKDGKLGTVAIHAKKARGALTDYIIRHQIKKSSALTDFSYGGYEYDPNLSTPETLYFVKRE